jgi:hypothetical protein
MSQMIQDGTGHGFLAEVDSGNHLKVKSTVISNVREVSDQSQQAFIVASDFVALTTTGSFNGILYIKNTSTDKKLYIETIRACARPTTTTAASNSSEWRIIKNPTTGTLISDVNAADTNNMNFASGITFSGDTYAASGDGKTVTDGTNFAQFINMMPGHSLEIYGGALELSSGNSLAITCKPTAAGDACVEIQCYFE